MPLAYQECNLGSCRLGARRCILRLPTRAFRFLEQIHRPVVRLDFRVQLSPVTRKIVHPRADGSDVDEPNQSDLRAALARLGLHGGLCRLVKDAVTQGKHVASGQCLRK